MKLAGFLLMPAGWVIVLTALILLTSGPSRGAFVLGGFGIELLGLVVAIRSHAASRSDER
jgi:uncharacterized membrane protein